jgi:tripartite-type tricarboxylate transporter receptor subunit TctC
MSSSSNGVTIGAPKNTPDTVVRSLNREINGGLSDSTIKACLADQGATANPLSPADFGSFIARETERFATVIRTARITGG